MTEGGQDSGIEAVDDRAVQAERAWTAVLDRRLRRGGDGGPLAEILAEALVAALVTLIRSGGVRNDASRVPSLKVWGDVLERLWPDDDEVLDDDLIRELQEAVALRVDTDSLERFVEQLGGSTDIGQVGEWRSWSPAHSTSPLYVHRFNWRGAVWSYVTGDDELIEALSYERGDPVNAYHAEYLCREDDPEDRRRGLIALTGRWFGAGLEWDPDPQIRDEARADSLYRFQTNVMDGSDPWDPPISAWNVDLDDQTLTRYAPDIANALGGPPGDVAAILSALQGDTASDPTVHDDDFMRAVKQELWWTLKEHDRGW